MSGGERFEVTERSRWDVTRGVDRQTGAPVIFPEPSAEYFLDMTAMRAQARVVRELDDPRVARVLSVDPVVLEGPPAEREAFEHRELVDAAIELVEVTSWLMHAGIAVAPSLAWIVRDERSAPWIRVPAPSAALGLHEFHGREWPTGGALGSIGYWLRRSVEDAACFVRPVPRALNEILLALPGDDTVAFLSMLAPHASDPRRALERVRTIAPLPQRPRPLLDLERGIENGERDLRLLHRLPERQRPFVVWPLAAAYHHRGCVAWEREDREAARRDVAHAIELDPHARYLTTAALFAERSGELELAAELHDRAASAIQPEIVPGPHRIAVHSDVDDPPWIAARDAARTLHARGVFHAKNGRLAEALADLEASIARKPTDAAERARAVVRRKLA